MVIIAMLMIQQFMAMSKEERIEAGNQMDGQEKNQIMFEFARMNTSIDGKIHQSLSEQQTSQAGNETSDLLLIGSFVGVRDGIHESQALQKLFL